ncbi:MAG: hypothetical protein ABR936_17530 [Bacteroidota bacterium]|jgi:hypothetical protein
MHISEFHYSVEEILKKEIEGNYPHQWDEDHITRQILRQFRNQFHSINLFGFKHETKIAWEVYKLVGSLETNAGDIGLLVNVYLKNGTVVTGVAFIEAKKRKLNTVRFDELRQKQLRRINRFSPSARLLLYDYEDITQFPLNQSHFIDPDEFRYYNLVFNNTYAVTLPMNLALANFSNNTNLYHLSVPFSYQLIFRYFHGLDLDYSKKAIDSITQFPSSQKLPRYLMTISVGIGTNIPEIVSNLFRDFYSILE